MRDLAVYWQGRELCLLYFTGTGVWKRKADVCGLPAKSLSDSHCILCVSVFRGAKSRQAKAGMTENCARTWAFPEPIIASGDGGAQHPAGLMHKAFIELFFVVVVFVCTVCDFLLFTLNARSKQKLTAWEEADCVFFCAAFHLFVFGWLWNVKPKDDGNGFPGGGGRREQRTPSSGLAYNYRLEGRRARKRCDRMRRTPATLAMNSMCFGLCSPKMGDPEMLEQLRGTEATQLSVKPRVYHTQMSCAEHRSLEKNIRKLVTSSPLNWEIWELSCFCNLNLASVCLSIKIQSLLITRAILCHVSAQKGLCWISARSILSVLFSK